MRGRASWATIISFSAIVPNQRGLRDAADLIEEEIRPSPNKGLPKIWVKVKCWRINDVGVGLYQPKFGLLLCGSILKS